MDLRRPDILSLIYLVLPPVDRLAHPPIVFPVRLRQRPISLLVSLNKEVRNIFDKTISSNDIVTLNELLYGDAILID